MEEFKLIRTFDGVLRKRKVSQVELNSLKPLKVPKELYVASSTLRDVLHPGYALVYLYTGQHFVREKSKTLSLATENRILAVYNGLISELAKLARFSRVEITHGTKPQGKKVMAIYLTDDSPALTVQQIKKVSFILNTITVTPQQYWAYCEECDANCGELWQTNKSIVGNTRRDFILVARFLKDLEVTIHRAPSFSSWGRL